MNIIIFILVLSILVIVHEWGHFITAKFLGVRVEKFSVGFGPKLFSRLFQGTEFMVCAIPLGGYVKMVGDERSNCVGTKEEFYSHPIWHRAFIVVMGPVINFLFAYICFYLIFVTGFPMLMPKVGKVIEGYPAHAAGLKENDKIVQIDSQEINTWEDMQSYILSSKGQALNFVIERNSQQIPIIITPQEKQVKNIFDQEERVRIIGIEPTRKISKEEMVFIKYGIGESFAKAFDQIAMITTLTFKSLYHVMIGAIPVREALAGPVRIFDVVKDAAMMGITHLIYIMGVISASLAIFNLFPVPVLDGGHLFLFALEKIRGNPLPLKVEERLTRMGFSLLMCLMIFVLYNDLVQVGWIDKLRTLFDSSRP